MTLDTIIIGAGQAGLAIGRLLAEQGAQFTILEAADQPASAWRERWDSLRLFTPARFDSLPGERFPGDPDQYPTRDEVIAYLSGYARELPVEYHSRVIQLRAAGGSYSVELAGRRYEADQVVVATGPFQTPRTPEIANDLDPRVHQLHRRSYRSPCDIPAGPVLVVGGGNTGYQIAEELSATHEVHLSVGSWQIPLPQRLFGRDLFRTLEAVGAMGKTVDSRLGERLKDRDSLIGSSPRKARRLGIHLHGRAIRGGGPSVEFAPGGSLEPRTVIWATGFGVDHSWIDARIFDDCGRLIHRRGVTPSPGLYFLGLPWQHTRGSALLGWVRHDAAHLAAAIAAHRRSSRTTVPTGTAA